MSFRFSKIHFVSIGLVILGAGLVFLAIREMRLDFSGASTLIQRESFERLVKERVESQN